MTNRVNNITLLNTPARARLITRADSCVCELRYSSRVSRMATADFFRRGEEKISERFSLLINLLLPSFVSLESVLVSNIRQVYTRKLDKGTTISPLRWRNHCLRSNVYGNTHRVEIEDATNDPDRARPGICEQLSTRWMWREREEKHR